MRVHWLRAAQWPHARGRCTVHVWQELRGGRRRGRRGRRYRLRPTSNSRPTESYSSFSSSSSGFYMIEKLASITPAITPRNTGIFRAFYVSKTFLIPACKTACSASFFPPCFWLVSPESRKIGGPTSRWHTNLDRHVRSLDKTAFSNSWIYDYRVGNTDIRWYV